MADVFRADRLLYRYCKMRNHQMMGPHRYKKSFVIAANDGDKANKLMDLRAFQFATRGHCIKDKQCHHITVRNNKISLCSKEYGLFSIYAEPSIVKLKGTLVHRTIRDFEPIILYLALQRTNSCTKALLFLLLESI